MIPSTREGGKIPAKTRVITNESLQAARPAQNYVPAQGRTQRTALAENIDAARERHARALAALEAARNPAPVFVVPSAPNQEQPTLSDPFREASQQPLMNDPFAELDRRGSAQLLSQSSAAQPVGNVNSEHRSAARRRTGGVKMDTPLLILGILQVIALLLYRWVGKVYFSQPAFNHPGIFRNEIAAMVLCYGPLAAMVVLVVLAFVLTDAPWWFLGLSVAGWVACSPSPRENRSIEQ